MRSSSFFILRVVNIMNRMSSGPGALLWRLRDLSTCGSGRCCSVLWATVIDPDFVLRSTDIFARPRQMKFYGRTASKIDQRAPVIGYRITFRLLPKESLAPFNRSVIRNGFLSKCYFESRRVLVSLSRPIITFFKIVKKTGPKRRGFWSTTD